MINTPSAPAAPSPAATAAAQTGSNVNTALTQTALNNVNQVTPYGSLTYSQTPGSTTINTGVNGVGGKDINVPQWTATQTLSPQQQTLFDLGQQTQQNIGQIGVNQSQKIGDLLNTPVDLSPGAVSKNLMDLATYRLDPELNRQWNDRESELFNRGILPGSEAYGREQDAFNRQKNDAYNQIVLNGQGQAVQQLLAQRNQPINEITALMSGSQVSQPNFVNTPQTNVQPTNVAGIYNDAYQNQLAAYNTAQSGQNSMMGGLFGLGSAALMAPMTGGTSLGGWGASKLLGLSDRRFKTKIREVGKLDNGLTVYAFQYKFGGPTQLGVMADDVEKENPEAVTNVMGVKFVDYDRAVL